MVFIAIISMLPKVDMIETEYPNCIKDLAILSDSVLPAALGSIMQFGYSVSREELPVALSKSPSLSAVEKRKRYLSEAEEEEEREEKTEKEKKGGMAIPFASSSALLISPKPLPSPSASFKTPFLGFPKSPLVAAKKPSFPTPLAKKKFQIRCQDLLSVIPAGQEWMFDESDITGPDIWNKTWYPKAADHITTEKTWYVVDATDKILGRLASTIAIHIRGKNLATYTPSVDMGAFVIVVNAEKVAVSGKKRTQKLYRRHSGRPGGMKVETFDQLQKRIPERIVEHAVRGMLPKGRLGRRLFTHLKVYAGPDHPHEAQKPIDLPIRDKRILIDR